MMTYFANVRGIPFEIWSFSFLRNEYIDILEHVAAAASPLNDGRRVRLSRKEVTTICVLKIEWHDGGIPRRHGESTGTGGKRMRERARASARKISRNAALAHEERAQRSGAQWPHCRESRLVLF